MSREIEAKIVDVTKTVKKIYDPTKYDFDIKSFKSGIEHPAGYLWVIIDELVNNQVSYFLRERIGLFKNKVMPILLKDEKPELLLNMSAGWFRKIPLLFTGRRFLIVFNDFIQSKWIRPAFQSLFSLFGTSYWKDGLLKETKYDGLLMSCRLRQGLPSKYVEIGWIKHIYQDGWTRVYNPLEYTPYERKVRAEDFLDMICKKAQEAIETDVLDLIALEDFCLTKDLEVYKIGVREIGTSRLKNGRLNPGKKKMR